MVLIAGKMNFCFRRSFYKSSSCQESLSVSCHEYLHAAFQGIGTGTDPQIRFDHVTALYDFE